MKQINLLARKEYIMASVFLKDLKLSQATVTGRKDPLVEVDRIFPRYKIDPTSRTRTQEIESYNVDIRARNMLQTVKLQAPLDEAIFKQIAEALISEKTVYVSFTKFVGKPYALLSDGRIVSGVSCKAETLKIESIEDPIDEELDDDVIL